MTDKPVKPLSERIREAENDARFARRQCARIEDALLWRTHAKTLGFLAELAEEQAEIKAMLQARKDK